MGEMAEYYTEQGVDELIRHRSNMCDDLCVYCEEEYEELEELRKHANDVA